MSSNTNRWTDEQIVQLRSLQAAGLSMREIADAIGAGHSRNSIISKIHRLGMSAARMNQGRPRYKQRPNRGPFQKPPKLKAVAAVDLPPEPVANPVTLLDLTEFTCRWPIGDPQSPDFVFCGAMPAHGHPYCGWHCGMACQRTPSQSRGERELLVRRMAKMRGAKAA